MGLRVRCSALFACSSSELTFKQILEDESKAQKCSHRSYTQIRRGMRHRDPSKSTSLLVLEPTSGLRA